MAKAINTSFDKAIEEDVALEQLDGQPPAVQTTLKNAENVYKSFLYLRKMYSHFPAKNTILSMATVSNAALEVITILPGANYIVVNNYSGATASIDINGGEYILQAGEKESFPIVSPDASAIPVVAGDTVSLKGAVSYIVKNTQEY